MSTNRPAPTTQISWESVTAPVTAIAAAAALIVTTLIIALAAFAAGAYPHRDSRESTTAPASRTETSETPARAAGHGTAEPSSAGLLDPSVGRGSGSRVCATSPQSPRCRLEGGSGLSHTRGGHALRPADDTPETVLLHSEWDETGPADMPGRAPGRGGWVGEEGPCRA